MISYRRVQRQKKANYCIRFGHSLRSANQLPAQEVKFKFGMLQRYAWQYENLQIVAIQLIQTLVCQFQAQTFTTHILHASTTSVLFVQANSTRWIRPRLCTSRIPLFFRNSESANPHKWNFIDRAREDELRSRESSSASRRRAFRFRLVVERERRLSRHFAMRDLLEIDRIDHATRRISGCPRAPPASLC